MFIINKIKLVKKQRRKKKSNRERNQVHKKILLTGFKPFSGRKANVTQDIANSLDGLTIEGIQIRSLVMPVKWGAPQKEIENAIKVIKKEKQQLVAILGLGECSAKKIIDVEEQADNKRGENKDEFNQTPGKGGVGTQTIPGGPKKYEAQPQIIKLITKALRKEGIDFSVTKDAGNFLCEESFYVSMHLLSPGGGQAGKAGFVHIPAYPNEKEDKFNRANAKHFKTMRKAVIVILRSLANRLRKDP